MLIHMTVNEETDLAEARADKSNTREEKGYNGRTAKDETIEGGFAGRTDKEKREEEKESQREIEHEQLSEGEGGQKSTEDKKQKRVRKRKSSAGPPSAGNGLELSEIAKAASKVPVTEHLYSGRAPWKHNHANEIVDNVSNKGMRTTVVIIY